MSTKMIKILMTYIVTTCMLYMQPLFAQMPEVDANEVARLGNMVQSIDKFGKSSTEVDDLYVLAMSTPENDNDRWYVTLIIKNGCVHCKKLLTDFEKLPLAALINETKGPDGKTYKPWAHFNVYNVDDGSQSWRIRAYRIYEYPTIVIQPPRSGKYGDPRNVVWQQSGYDGDANKLMERIQNGVKNYLRLIAEANRAKNKVGEYGVRPFLVNLVGYSQEGDLDIGNPPFPIINPSDQVQLQPKIVEWPPSQNQNQNQNQNQPQVSLSQVIVLLIQAVIAILNSTGLGNLLLLIMVIYWTLERIAPLTPNQMDDKIVAVLKEALEKKDQSGKS